MAPADTSSEDSRRGLRSVLDVRAGEGRIAALMATYFFLVITSFWILKPLKKTLFIGYYAAGGWSFGEAGFEAAQAEQIAKVLNMGVAIVAAIVFSVLAVRLRRQQLTYVFTTFFIVFYGVFAWALTSPSDATVWSFYLFGDLFSTLMVATFFAFLNDSVSSDAAKRLYGLIGFGGVVGGVFGSTAVAVWISTLSIQAWLGIAAGIGFLILLIARAAAAELAATESQRSSVADSAVDTPDTPDAASDAASDAGREDKAPGAFEGIQRVFSSGYLFAIVAIVGLYELASTVLDYQFTQAMVLFSESPEVVGQNIASTFAFTNWFSMAVQLLVTSFVMQRFGVGVALMVLPLAMATASMGFAWMPSLLLGGLLNTADNGFSYSINQSAKETLYVVTSPAEKYQAKAFIDMFVQRFAKAIGVGLSIIVTKNFTGVDGLRSLSYLILPVLGLWTLASMYAGKRFKELESE